jgi:HK97 family phage prohead protease
MPASYAIKDWNDAERSFRVVASTSRPIKRTELDADGKEVEFFEALDGWNFQRFAKNPLVLESHDAKNIDSAIGQASDFEPTPDGGLSLKITLASAGANPRVTELERKIKEGLVRGVSVGWERGERTDEQRAGRMVRVYRNNLLQEVSLCLLPVDEDALIEAEEDPELQRRERVSNAGRALAAARLSKAVEGRTDAADGGGEHNRFDFLGTISKFTRTQVGGIRVPARLTRTGILEYRLPDGKIRRELRLPEEVFHADSLATLSGATVTDLDHHRGLLDSSNWKDATLGHAEEVRRDGKYVVADLLINDARAIAAIEGGRLHDISCGYRCRLDMTSGVWEGQPYDAIQRGIRYNHVAVLPKGRGRAGEDVALRLDAKDAECVEAQDNGDTNMTDVAAKRVIRIDGKDLDYGSEPHIKHLEDAHLKDLQKWETDKTDLTTRCDKAEGKVRAFEKKEEEDKKTSEEAKRASEAASARAFRQRLKLTRAITKALDVDEDDDEKMDALDAKSDRDLMIDLIRMDARWKNEKFDGKSDDFVLGIYETVAKSFTRTDGIDSVVETIERTKRLDSNDQTRDPEAQARANMNKDAYTAWTKPLSS